jgi:catechol 2,3-dioxygenase-like lactoylglutathione lyase family enzyme
MDSPRDRLWSYGNAGNLPVRAIRFNHVSISAVDMEKSLGFYIEIFGMERLPSPDFSGHVEWLRLGDQQLHLFHDETPAPERHHIALDVDDFEAAFLKAKELGVLEERTFGASVRELNDGAVQMYLRDPAGNLVEVDWPDVATLDRSVVTPIHRLADERPQSDEAARASLYFTAD